jgi:hypothetical protein
MLQRAPVLDHEGADVPIATLVPVVEVGYRALNCVRYELTAILDVDATDIPAATNSTATTSKTRLLVISNSFLCSVKLRDVTDLLPSNLRRPHFEFRTGELAECQSMFANFAVSRFQQLPLYRQLQFCLAK